MPIGRVKKPLSELEKATQNPKLLDNVIKGAGETALSMIQAQSNPMIAQGPNQDGLATYIASQGDATAGPPEAAPGYGATLQDVTREMPKQIKQAGAEKGGSTIDSIIASGKELGRGLIEGALGMANKGGSGIPYQAGKLLPDLMRTKYGLPTAGDATKEYQAQETARQANVFGNMDTTAYAMMHEDLAKVPETVLNDPEKSMPYYRALLVKYPSAKSFLAEYFGLTRQYNYNYPQGLPQGKYNVGASAVGAE